MRRGLQVANCNTALTSSFRRSELLVGLCCEYTTCSPISTPHLKTSFGLQLGCSYGNNVQHKLQHNRENCQGTKSLGGLRCGLQPPATSQVLQHVGHVLLVPQQRQRNACTAATRTALAPAACNLPLSSQPCTKRPPNCSPRGHPATPCHGSSTAGASARGSDHAAAPAAAASPSALPGAVHRRHVIQEGAEVQRRMIAFTALKTAKGRWEAGHECWEAAGADQRVLRVLRSSKCSDA